MKNYNTKLKLSFLDKYALQHLLPTTNTTYENLILREQIVEKVKFNHEELSIYLDSKTSEFKDEAMEEAFEIEFTKAECARISHELSALNSSNKLSAIHIHLYETFILNIKGQCHDNTDNK